MIVSSGAAVTRWLELLPVSVLQISTQNESLMSVMMKLMTEVGSQGCAPFLSALGQHTTALLGKTAQRKYDKLARVAQCYMGKKAAAARADESLRPAKLQ